MKKDVKLNGGAGGGDSSAQYSNTPTLQHSIAVVGLWHQGIVGAACLADLGYDVLAADMDEAKIESLKAGKAPLYEPGLNELIKKGLESGRLRFTADVAGAVQGRASVMLMHDTPVDENDHSDLEVVFRDVRAMAPNMESDTLLFVTAQVPVGTCDRIATEIRNVKPRAHFGIAYSPENLRLGQAIERFLKPPLPVIGADDSRTLDRVEQMLAPLGAEWKRVDLRTAEMTKHALNAFLATTVTFANELGNLCDEVGADGVRLAEVLRMEPRVGPKAMLLPGLGFSGGTLARDMQTLRNLGDRAGVETPMLDGVWSANRAQNRLVVRKLKRSFGRLDGVRVAVLGLTYKPDTSTLRRSAAIEIIGDMVREKMIVVAHDPMADRAEVAKHKEFIFVDDVYEALRGARAAVIITGWADYRKLDLDKIKALMANPLVVDVNNMLDADVLEKKGITCLNVGRGRHSGKMDMT